MYPASVRIKTAASSTRQGSSSSVHRAPFCVARAPSPLRHSAHSPASGKASNNAACQVVCTSRSYAYSVTHSISCAIRPIAPSMR